MLDTHSVAYTQITDAVLSHGLPVPVFEPHTDLIGSLRLSVLFDFVPDNGTAHRADDCRRCVATTTTHLVANDAADKVMSCASRWPGG